MGTGSERFLFFFVFGLCRLQKFGFQRALVIPVYRIAFYAVFYAINEKLLQLFLKWWKFHDAWRFAFRFNRLLL